MLLCFCIDMFVSFTRYSLRYLSQKLDISSRNVVIVQSIWHSLSLRNSLLVLARRIKAAVL